jgi:hypothetical protein
VPTPLLPFASTFQEMREPDGTDTS